MNRDETTLENAASEFVRAMLRVSHGRKVLLYRDGERPSELSDAIRSAAELEGATVEMLEFDCRAPIKESSAKLEEAIEGRVFDVVCELSEHCFYQSDAWKAARMKGVDTYSLAGLDAAAFMRCVGEVDQEKMYRFGQHLASQLKAGAKLIISSSSGTRITCDMRTPWYLGVLPLGRRKPRSRVGVPSGFLGSSGRSTSMGGQLAFQAIRKSINGIAVIDSYFWPPDEIGEFDSGSVILTIVKGDVVRLEGCERKVAIMNRWFGSNPMPIKHFCLGFNPGARLAGGILEAERAFGTLTIGVAEFPFHADGIIRKPTILIDDKCIVKNGEFADQERNDLLKSGDPASQPR
jgi:leucyl aminopeptidase (aminopeptidase T)